MLPSAFMLALGLLSFGKTKAEMIKNRMIGILREFPSDKFNPQYLVVEEASPFVSIPSVLSDT